MTDPTEPTIHCDVAGTEEIPPGTCQTVQAHGIGIALCNIDGKFYAVRDECPHQGVPLADGFLDGHELTCSLHGWTFDVRNGTWVGTGTQPLGCFPVRVEQERVLVEVPARAE